MGRSEGTVGTAPDAGDAADESRTTALPLHAEELHISKRDVVTGRVRVRTVVDTAEQLVRQDLDTEHVSVTRVPVDRLVEAAPQVRTEGEVTIIPVLEEILVVETKLVLKEEIHIRRRHSRETVEQAVSLRTQRAIIDTDEA